jgi:hypothetical protein
VIAVAGVVGFLTSRGDRSIQRTSRSMTASGQRGVRRGTPRRQNERRRSAADVVVRVGAPQVIDREGS